VACVVAADRPLEEGDGRELPRCPGKRMRRRAAERGLGVAAVQIVTVHLRLPCERERTGQYNAGQS